MRKFLPDSKMFFIVIRNVVCCLNQRNSYFLIILPLYNFETKSSQPVRFRINWTIRNSDAVKFGITQGLLTFWDEI